MSFKGRAGLSPASCHHVPVPPKSLCLSQVLVGPPSALPWCFAFSLVLVGFFMASDVMPGREEALGRSESWVQFSWCQFVASLIYYFFFQAALCTAPPKCLCSRGRIRPFCSLPVSTYTLGCSILSAMYNEMQILTCPVHGSLLLST